MATINFLLQSKNNPANIYVRLSDGRKIDVKTKTNFIIDPADWSDVKQRPKNLKNAALKNLDYDLQELRTNLLNYYNKSAEEKNLNWLKNFLNPVVEKEIPKDLIGYFDYYLKERENELNHRTVLKIKVVQNKLKLFQKEKKTIYLVKDVNDKFKKDFEKYNIDKGYSQNTILSNIKEIKGVCYHASKKGLEINSELATIKTAQKKAVSIYLTFDELEKIEKTDLKIKELQDARDWLIISCYSGQRVSDFMRFKKEMIRTQGKVKLIEFTQQKTGKIMTLPLHPKVLAILEKRKGNFPDATTDPKYNIAIKNVCKKAKLNELVYGGKNDPKTNRKVFKEYPKHELVTSHIGRRSFATNFYGKIPTSLLISATGHSTEQMFLIYIGKSNSDKAIQLADYF
ncbi:site-specific integrase [Flavobacterium aquiphilum]|uniref:site-specific integrase n=1 Tax=Flavobacterium aquiphilum TaxID=3003261 RepID=UPI0024803A81|nr:site-specific integrase [Flavobacterium aquiphilum]